MTKHAEYHGTLYAIEVYSHHDHCWTIGPVTTNAEAIEQFLDANSQQMSSIEYRITTYKAVSTRMPSGHVTRLANHP